MATSIDFYLYLLGDELKDRITATVLLVVRRRLIPEMFEAYLQSKDIQDERLDFLFGGEGHDYYQWKLFCVRCNHPGFYFLPNRHWHFLIHPFPSFRHTHRGSTIPASK